MKIILIRHGKTKGNTEKRYNGSTDEPLCDIGIAELETKVYPETDIVIASPMKRCLQSADIIYPNKEVTVINDLRECDFGDFENKNHHDLCDDPYYQKWLESMGTMPFPNGEDYKNFQKRCAKAFLESVHHFKNCETLAYVIHGGTMMALLACFAVPHKEFYDYMIGNGCGYICEFENGEIKITGTIQ